MLKNKIYNYLSKEIFKSFFTILFAFTAIAWTVKSVNFMDLMVEDGYPVAIYLQYSLFNISSIMTRFIPLAFLLALIISIIKFERQSELIILWTSGLKKTKIVHLFFQISIIVTLIQIVLAVVISPSALNKSRSLLKNSDNQLIASVIKSNDFSDAFNDVTIFVENKNDDGEMSKIFIRDESNAISAISAESEDKKNTTIIANKGKIENKKLILFNGLIQTQNQSGDIKNINFTKTELALDGFTGRTITEPKIQETSSYLLLQCILFKNNLEKFIQNCPFKKNTKEVVETIARRLGMPLYIPLVSLIGSFILIYKKEKKFNFLKKYIYFIIGFLILVFAEIMVRFTGFSDLNTLVYFLLPFLLMPLAYGILCRNFIIEKNK